MKKKTEKEIIKELKNKLEHAEKSRDYNYDRYRTEYDKVKSLEDKLKQEQCTNSTLMSLRGAIENREVMRLTEIIRWLINKDTAIIKDELSSNRNY